MIEEARAATPADLAPLAELARAAIAELEPMRGGVVWRLQEARREPIEASLEKLIGDPDALLLAGTIDGVVVGYTTARTEGLADGSRLGIIDEIFVDEEARGVGVGRCMLDRAVAWCHERGCRGIDSMALPGHRASKNFFEGFRFTARKLVMHRSLEPEATDPDAGPS